MGRRGSAEEFEVFAGHRAGVLALAPLSAVMGEHVPGGHFGGQNAAGQGWLGLVSASVS